MKALAFIDELSEAINEAEANQDTEIRLMVDGQIFFVTGTSIGHDEGAPGTPNEGEGVPVIVIEGTTDPGF